jgi:predicted nucleic-acid-binding Zn-ribbon protein
MRRGLCPKCGAAEVRGSRGNFSWGGEQGVRIKTSPLVRGTPVDTYVCVRCGYFEHYVADPGKLSEVAEQWGRVEPSPHNDPHVAP